MKLDVQEYKRKNRENEANILRFIKNSDQLCGVDLYTAFSSIQFSPIREHSMEEKQISQCVWPIRRKMQDSKQRVYGTDYSFEIEHTNNRNSQYIIDIWGRKLLNPNPRKWKKTIISYGCGPRKPKILNTLLDVFDNVWLVEEINRYVDWEHTITHIYQFVYEQGKIYIQGVEGLKYFSEPVATLKKVKPKGKRKIKRTYTFHPNFATEEWSDFRKLVTSFKF